MQLLALAHLPRMNCACVSTNSRHDDTAAASLRVCLSSSSQSLAGPVFSPSNFLTPPVGVSIMIMQRHAKKKMGRGWVGRRLTSTKGSNSKNIKQQQNRRSTAKTLDIRFTIYGSKCISNSNNNGYKTPKNDGSTLLCATCVFVALRIIPPAPSLNADILNEPTLLSIHVIRR